MPRKAFITGASKGIGRGIAYGLAEAGWHVAINYYNDEEGALETAHKVEELSPSKTPCLHLQGDVGDSTNVDRMFGSIMDEWGGLDLLVNNAGRQTWAPLLELKEEDFDRTIRTNLKGTFLCTQRAGRIMAEAKQGGSIINIGSACNKHPFPNLADYTASKGGIEQFTKVSAAELGPMGIRVNCIAPGAIEIERTREESPDYAKTWSAITPMRRVGTPKDVADAVVYFASEGASFVSGQTVYIDGAAFTLPQWPY